MAVRFRVAGPHEVLCTRMRAGRSITKDDITGFWNHHSGIADDRGCYVFCIRSGPGILPWYVGKATRSFQQEVFQAHKLAKYHEVLADTRRGTPVMFFVIAPVARGKPNNSAIADCERQLIQLAVRTHPELINIQGIKGPSFVVPHVTETTQGRPSQAALDLCRTLGLSFDQPRTSRESVPTQPVPNPVPDCTSTSSTD